MIGESTAEVSLNELLDIATKEFDKNEQTICERQLLRDWEELRQTLQGSMTKWAAAPAAGANAVGRSDTVQPLTVAFSIRYRSDHAQS